MCIYHIIKQLSKIVAPHAGTLNQVNYYLLFMILVDIPFLLYLVIAQKTAWKLMKMSDWVDWTACACPRSSVCIQIRADGNY